MTPPEARQFLADEVDAVLPAEWTTYAYPPEQLSLPAAVVTERSPYRRPGTFCAEILSLAVQLLEARSSSVEGRVTTDLLATTVRDTLGVIAGVAYESMDGVPPVTAPGGVEVEGVALNIEYYI